MGFLPDNYVLNHSLVPRRSQAVPLARVVSLSQALDYAAGGFHACVDRAYDQQKLGNNGAVSLWIQATSAYLQAYNSGITDVSTLKQMLQSANESADTARAASTAGTQASTPPRLSPGAASDPMTSSNEYALEASATGMPEWLLPVAIAGGALLLLKKSGKGGKRSRRRR